MAIKLVNSNIFTLPGTHDRWLHLAEVQRGLHTFLHFYDTQTGKAYIEELIGGQLTFIQNEALVYELEQELIHLGVHHSQRINLADTVWRHHPLNRVFFPLGK